MSEFNQQQLDFIANYFNPESETFNNAKQSALKVGYTEEYASVMLARKLKWMSDYVSQSENIGRKKRIIEKAENNLETLLDEEDKRVKADMTKFALSRLKKEDYSEKTETEHKGNINLNINEEQALRIIQRRSGSNPSPITE
jgi:hypothetical protein